MYIHIHGDVHSVIVTVIGNGHGYSSSIPE